MHPLKIKPGHAINGLALSPDGQKLGVVQSPHGFRLFDTVTGVELGRDTDHAGISEQSPTAQHSLAADRTAVRLAEVTAGKPFLCFQTGWSRVGALNRPPAEPGTSALRASIQIGARNSFDRRRRSQFGYWSHLFGDALTADHRFAVGRSDDHPQPVVCDLAHESLLAAHLDLKRERPGIEFARWEFTPDETHVVALTPQALFVFALPPPTDLGAQLPARVPALEPVGTVRIRQPQPDANPPPFAVLPCGTKVLVRGEKSRIELRDLFTSEVLTVWKWGLPKVYAIAVAGDGLTAAAGGDRGHVMIWDLG